MNKAQRYISLLLATWIFSITSFAQTITVSGNVKNAVGNEGVQAVSVTIKGAKSGTFTDEKGNFKLTTNRPLPLTLFISSIGFQSQEVIVNNASDFVQVNLVSAPT